ncbi:MAG: YsnF/AvaK domain-containing protein, partial [Rubrobacter sp.]|nr:YsnF/AvaK domain-containing protein [Rubrobacter sp.]
ATVNNEQGFIEVSQSKDSVKNGPAFDDDKEITPEYESEVRSYYGLGAVNGTEDRGSYGDYEGEQGEHSGAGTTDSGSAGTVGSGMSMGDTESGEFREHDRNQEGVSQPGSDLEDEDELRVQRSEEELRAGTREREAGSMKVRKRVRTDRERIEVPTKHEEVSVERVPVSGEATEAQIGEDEVNVPVTEEEVVTDKRAVAKEEIRLRKDVAEDTEVVEDDVRREEVDVEDATERGRGTDR